MDPSNLKLPKPSITGFVVMTIFGGLVAVGVYQAQIRGWIPMISNLPKAPGVETRTILQEENAVISVVEKTSPSVVAIGISKKVHNPLDPFASLQNKDSTIGTGFVVSKMGIIVTNKHVVAESGIYTVVTNDSQKYEVKKIYRDPNFDLALVQIDADSLKPLELGDSSKLRVGQTLVAIGNALGKFTNTVTTGVVSGLGRSVVAGDYYITANLDDLIRTAPAIKPGNSGGPLLNSAGQVIGVSVAITEGAQNIGFGIPINSVKAIVDEFVAKGTISRPYLGIQYRFISEDLAKANDAVMGAYIQGLVEGGPAQKGGLKQGDIITKINGQNVNSEKVISDIVTKSNINQELEIIVFRNKKEGVLKVVLEDASDK